jgi:hypothetical protein
MQKIKLTEEEDNMYNKFMGKYLNISNNELKAEEETIRELKEMFPRLKKLLKKGVKIYTFPFKIKGVTNETYL